MMTMVLRMMISSSVEPDSLNGFTRIVLMTPDSLEGFMTHFFHGLHRVATTPADVMPAFRHASQ